MHRLRFIPLLALVLIASACSESSNEGDNPFAGLLDNGFFLNNFVLQECRRLPESEEVADTRDLVFADGSSPENAEPDQSVFTGICVITPNS